MPNWGSSTLVYAVTSNALIANAVEPWRQLERDRIVASSTAIPAPQERGIDITAQRAAPDYGADGSVTRMPHVFPAVEVT